MILKKYFNYENIILLFILAMTIPYSFLNSSGGNYTFSLPLVLLCIFYLGAFHNKRCKNTVIRQIMISFLILSLFTSYTYFRYNIRYTSYPLFVCNSISPYLLFLVLYNYSSRNKDYDIIWLFYLLFYSVGLYYISYQQALRENFLMQINNFYFVVTPLPFLFLNKNVYLRVLFMALTTFCVIISLKRSGFIIVVLLLFYMVYSSLLAKANLSRKVLFVLTFGMSVYVGSNYLGSMDTAYDERILERMENIDVDRGSGRLDLAQESWGKISEMNLLEIIIGKGYSAIDSETGQSNGYHTFHNDYSEVMYSFGFIGLTLLLFFIWHILKNCIKCSKKKSDMRLSIVSSFIILIVFSLTSSVFHYFYFMLPLFAFWGYIEPKMNRLSNK